LNHLEIPEAEEQQTDQGNDRIGNRGQSRLRQLFVIFKPDGHANSAPGRRAMNRAPASSGEPRSAPPPQATRSALLI
jgi:hypothetical protein